MWKSRAVSRCFSIRCATPPTIAKKSSLIFLIWATIFLCCTTACLGAAPNAPIALKELKLSPVCGFMDSVNVTGNRKEYGNGQSNVWNNIVNGQYLANAVAMAVDLNATKSEQISNVTAANKVLNATRKSAYMSDTTIYYVHENVRIPSSLISEFDFVIEKLIRKPVAKHERGCVCKLKPCVRICCPPGSHFDIEQRKCIKTTKFLEENIYKIVLENNTRTIGGNLTAVKQFDLSAIPVKQANGSASTVDANKHFYAYYGTPCDRMRYLQDDNKFVEWNLYENGTIAYKNRSFSNLYCYTPMEIEENSSWQWQPLQCLSERLPFVLGVMEWTYAIVLIIDVICMSIIFIIYLVCNKLRNTFYGLAIIAYALCTMIAYSLLAHLTLTEHLSKSECSNIPAVIMLFIILSFYVLCTVSINFYLSFNGFVFSAIVFVFILIPMALVAIGWTLFVMKDTYDNKPVFGMNTCWFDPRNISIVLYHYAPMILAFVFSLLFYGLTVKYIKKRGKTASKTKLNREVEDNRFKSFWNFGAYTYCAWLVCLTSFTVNYLRDKHTHINYAVCVTIAIHGLGSLYSLVGMNIQVQDFLLKLQEGGIDDDDDDAAENSVPMVNY